MKNKVIIIDKKQAEVPAREYFAKMCGFDGSKEKHKSMMDDALEVRNRILDDINIRAVVSSFSQEKLKGKVIDINGVTFACNALEQIRHESICEIYAYILTVGMIDLPNTSLLELLYADTWGTAYVDAGRDILRALIRDMVCEAHRGNTDEKTGRLFVSDSFGPGYYGMDVTQVKLFFEILDSKKIGVKMTENGLMVPIKSCTGFYIVVDDEKQLPGADCKSCLSNAKGCQFCRAKVKHLQNANETQVG